MLDSALFRSLPFNKPSSTNVEWATTAHGKFTIDQVVRLLQDVSKEIGIVALGIAEHLPREAMNMRDMLGKLPLLSD